MRAFGGWVAAALLLPCVAFAQEEEGLEELSLEELLSLDLEVTSASKHAEDLSKASAAIYALTGDEIRRIGATSLPEALRIVPGVHVARADAQSWAISARGFNGRFNTRMLVLLDGRSVYTPLFGGVYWDQQDVLLDDVGQVEVIRGPGGALWGANAINGVINVRSKTAAETQGLLAHAGGGNEEGFGAVRWGGKAGAAAYRVYAKYGNHQPQAAQLGDPRANDGWRNWRGGVRVDFGDFTLLADGYGSSNDYTFFQDTTTPPYLEVNTERGSTDGQSAVLRWTRGTLQAQTYVERIAQASSVAKDERITGDLDVQKAFALGTWNTLTFGGGARFHHDTWTNGEILAMNPRNRDDLIVNAYVQDEARFFAEKLRIQLGTKVERNDTTGIEVQPSARVAFSPHGDHTVWAAASRAVRTPARVEEDGEASVGIFIADPDPLQITVIGSKDLKAETLVAIEGGYRFEWGKRFSIDTAIFHNEYDELITGDSRLEALDFSVPGRVGIPFANVDHGVIYGGEVSAKVNVNERFAIAAAWSHLYPDLPSELAATATPKDFWNLRLYMNVAENAEWNIVYYSYEPSGFYDEERLRGNDLTIPAFARLDMGFTMRFLKRFEVAVWGQNLVNERHIEVKEGYINPPTEVERSFYGKLTTRF